MTKSFLPFLLAAACVAASAEKALAIPHGRIVRHLTVDGVVREVVIHVPVSVDGSQDVPVVFMLHGTSGDGDKFYNISGWVPKADQEGFIAVFPSALTYCLGDDEDYDGVIEPNEYKITTKWAAGKLGTEVMPLCTDEQVAAFPPNRQAQIESRILRDDVAFIDAIVDALEELVPADLRRLYVTGFSNGASMSGRLLVERTNTFAAFAMAAGTPTVPGPALRPAPVVFTVGSLDDRFLVPLGLGSLPLDETLLDIPEIRQGLSEIALDVQLDDTQVTFEPTPVQGHVVPVFRYDQSLVCGADNVFLAAVIEGATHQYPNGTNHPLVMANVLWSFFSQYSLP
jgi:polyhydroxybutyrate depolymerase